MSTLNAYLSFDGNCLEAMKFYQSCIGGKLNIQTIGDSPLAEKMPPQMKDQVLHASLANERFEIMGTDCAPGEGLRKGNAVSLCMICGSEEEVHHLFEKLSEGGKKKFPLELTFWGALFGGLTDKYGQHWLLNYHIPDIN